MTVKHIHINLTRQKKEIVNQSLVQSSLVAAVVLNILCTLSGALVKKYRSLDLLPNRCSYNAFCVEPEMCIFNWFEDASNADSITQYISKESSKVF